MIEEATKVLVDAGGEPGHVFNLGHGVLPETDPSSARPGRRDGARLAPRRTARRRWAADDSPRRHVSGFSSWPTGLPSSPEQVEAFYTDVRRGRPPSAEQLADLVGRYEAIGGVSPLSRRTAEQVAGIQQQLELRYPGRFVCTLGNKHAEPRIEGAVESLAEQEVRERRRPRPRPSLLTRQRRRVRRTCDGSGRTSSTCPPAFIEQWHDHPVLIDLLAERVSDAVESLGTKGQLARGNEELLLLVTAHSLPVRIVADGDPYADQLRRTG